MSGSGSGLYESVIDRQLERGLPQDLAPVSQNQHALTTLWLLFVADQLTPTDYPALRLRLKVVSDSNLQRLPVSAQDKKC
jgi:hypothetical protein